MDGSSMSAVWSQPRGKLKRRVQDLRIPSYSQYDFQANRSKLDLSHSESSRLAVDCLLSRGLKGYREVLNTEGEVDFLSKLDKNYIKENGKDADTVDPDVSDDDDDEELESSSADYQSLDVFPAVSDDCDRTEAGQDRSRRTGVNRRAHVLDGPNVEIYFKSDSSIKDLVREFIRKAKTALAIVMDCFTDVELLCDLLEASLKRDVTVHLLLDHLNLNLFISMWQELKLNSKHFPKLSVCSVDGQTYCAKTGRKLTGQIAESFIIADSNEVLTGSYSFSWMSWQVHRSLAVVLKGSSVAPFQQEFHRLSSSSTLVSGFVTVPPTLSSSTTSEVAQCDNTHKRRSKSNWNEAICRWSEDAAQPQVPADVQCSGFSYPQNAEPLHLAGTQSHRETLLQIQFKTKLYPKPVIQPRALQSVSVEKREEEKKTQIRAQAVTQFQSHSNPLGQTHISYTQSHLAGRTITTTADTAENLLGQTHVSCIQPQLAGLNFTTTAEKTVNTLGSLANGQHRTTCYQSHFRTNSNLDYLNVGPEGLFIQQRNTGRLTKPSGFTPGLIAHREQWSYSLNVKQNVDFVFDNPSVLCPSTAQQNLTKTHFQFPLTLQRGHASVLETQSSQSSLRSHWTSDSEGSDATAKGTRLSPQLQTDSRVLLLDSESILHPQRTSRLKWSLNASPRPRAGHSFFDTTFRT